MGSLFKGLATLLTGGSFGEAVSSALGFAPLIKTPYTPNDIVGNAIDNSFIGQVGNDFLGTSKSSSAKEEASRNNELSLRDDEMKFVSDEAKTARDWQERMRDTQYLSTAKQLKELGINPYVMLSGLSGASTPGTSAASYSGYASARTSANASYNSTRYSFLGGIANSAISALALLGRAAILGK